ncbi:hypothetical protein Y032_0119g794 [Ancylostoma ceylanicum]|uniref:G-protein coupled receptors family 1 profile domain-containing protein n=1 Tax=Ancylostoma ceylanicum TaxID=53326 RepID=A0A016TB26_9BILA|nr:hypothetical protein Y032_0119g794 [Ancylostoma ceylanicum]
MWKPRRRARSSNIRMLDLFNLLGWGDFWEGEDLPRSASSRLVHIVNISQSQPPWLARPLYGLAAPAIILVTLVTNSFIVVVLSNKNLRTPTNHILLSMAITELMTGLSSCPWFLYYYTFGGLYHDQEYGLPDFWCKTHPYFAVHFPTIFHTAAIWLTVYLAIQRYIYVCLPSLVVRFCTPKKTRHIIIYICICAFVSELPVMLTEYSVSLPLSNTTRSCFHKNVDIIDSVVGVDSWKAMLLCLRALFVHILPCALLIIFTTCLFKTVNEADRKRSINQMPCRKVQSTSGCLSSNRLMHATTRMLLVVIAIFLLIEIPVALIFIMHLLVVFYRLLDMSDYKTVNNLLIIRNFLIILTYPLNFAIYFGMSSSFKLQFRQLFSRQVLYITSPADGAGWRPRFSVQLIDIHKLRRPSRLMRKMTQSYGQKRMSATALDAAAMTDEYL